MATESKWLYPPQHFSLKTRKVVTINNDKITDKFASYCKVTNKTYNTNCINIQYCILHKIIVMFILEEKKPCINIVITP
jgi:hypothetical protein